MSKNTLTLNIESTDLRFLVTKGKRVEKWGSLSLEPAATMRPGEFHGREVVAGRSGDAHDRRVENRPVSRQQNSPRDIERPVARQEAHGNRVAQPKHETRRPENRGGSQPSAYHPESARPHQNAPQHETHSGGGHDQRRH